MKIVISNYETGEVYEEIEDATVSQMVAYGCSGAVVIDEKEFVAEDVVIDHSNQILSIMVSEA